MSALIRTPGTQRDVFELLASYDQQQGLMKALEGADWTGVTPVHVYLAVLNRLPETLDQAITRPDYSAIEQVYTALLSKEFQNKIVNSVLEAYSEKRRLLFVHVPKCAGTDLVENISANLPWLFQDMGRPLWVNTPSLLLLLQRFAIRARESDTIFVSGHNTLRWYITNRLLRNGDRLFAVIRRPQEMVVSSVNYVLGRFRSDPACSEPDTREWAGFLGFESFDPDMGGGELHSLAIRILKEPKIVPPNNICAFLGDGTAASAIELMGRCNIELTDTSHYRTWLMNTWEIASDSRHNASRPILQIADLNQADMDYILDLWTEDLQLYDLVLRNIVRRGDGHAYGSELF